MVAAVRMAYGIADAQVERSTALAKRLKGEGDRQVGGESGLKAVDAASRLINNAMLSGMAWLETLATSDDALGSRLVAAQLKAVQGVLTGGDGRGGAGGPQPDQTAQPSAQSAPPPAPPRSVRNVKIVLGGDPKMRRAIRIVRWDLVDDVEGVLYFSWIQDPAVAPPLEAKLVARSDEGAPWALEMKEVPQGAPSGAWRAPACDSAGVQRGVIEIEI
jgi:hypothetical protein